MTDITDRLDLSLPLNRRGFLRGALATGAGAAFAGPFAALAARTAGAAPGNGNGGGRPSGLGYGPLRPVPDTTTGLELLLLPRGFEYMSFGWRDESMSDGIPTPSAHDGMAAFRRGDRVHLVRNHERDSGPALRRRRSGVRPGRFRRDDQPRLRPRPGDDRRELRQPERHDPQLRRRADAPGHVADVRGDARSSAASATGTCSRCRRTRRRTRCR